MRAGTIKNSRAPKALAKLELHVLRAGAASPKLRARLLCCSALLAGALAGTGPLHAQTVWTGGAGDGLWQSVGNWNNGLPASGVVTRISTGASVSLDNASGATSNLLMAGGSTLTVSGGASLTSTRWDVGYFGAGTMVITGTGTQGTVNGTGIVRLVIGNGASGNLTVTDGATVDTGGVSVASVVLLGASSGTGNLTLSAVGSNRGALEALGVSRSAGTLTFDGGILRATGANSNLLANFGSGDIVINAGGAFIDSNGFNITIAAPLGGTGGLTKLGAETLSLTTANSYSGLTTISAGYLNVSDAGALGTSGTGTLVASGGALQVSNDIAIASEALTLNGTGPSGLGALRSFSGSNTFGGDITLGSASLITASGGSDLTLSGDISGPFGLTVGGAGTTSITGDIATGTGSLTKEGTGALVLSGTNSFTGVTFINAGTLNAGAADVLSSSSDLVFADVANATFYMNGYDQSIRNLSGGGSTGGNVSITTGATLTVTPTTTSTYAGTLFGGGNLIKAGGNVLVLYGNNTFSGTTTINGGELRLGSSDALSGTSMVTIAASANTYLNLNGFNATIHGLQGGGSGGYVEVEGSALTIDQTSNTTFSGNIRGAGSVAKAGTGRLTLDGSSTFSGGLAVTGGLVNFNTGLALGSGIVALNGGGLQWATGTSTDISSVLTLGVSSGTIDTNGNNVAFASAVGGGGGLIKAGSGILTLQDANTFAGSTTVSAGQLTITSGSALSNSARVTVSSGATLNVNTLAETVGSLGGEGTVQLNANLTVGGDNSASTFSGSINGAGALTKAGTGRMTLAGINGFTGAMTISAGVVIMADDAALGGTAAGTTIASGAALEVGGNSMDEALTLNGSGISGAGALRHTGSDSFLGGNITLGSAATIASDSGTLNLSGTLAGAGFGLTFTGAGDTVFSTAMGPTLASLTKLGAGTLTLEAVNTYTGATTITAGTLALSGAGSIASSIGVLVDGTFDISGITGAGTSVINLSGDTTTGVVALGTKTLTVTQQTEFLQLAGGLSGSGTLIKQGAEALTLSGDSSAFTGTIQVNAGTLSITDWSGTTSGTVGGNVTVASGGTLEAAGATIGGAVTIETGGILEWTRNGANIGAIAMDSLFMDTGAITRINLATPSGGSSILEVQGNATVNGTLNLVSAPAYGAGVYRVVTTGGALTDNGMMLGEIQPDYTFRLDAQAQSLDVVVTALDTDVQYWSADGTTRGGGGNWTAFNNWLGADGGYAAWAGHTAVFDGPFGIVMVDGTQSFNTIEFLTSGYNLQAGVLGQLNLGSGGRLWAEGDDIIVTVSAPIIGTGALTKIGEGTIVLAGTNTYSGGTIIQAGTLEISSDANLGDAAGTITFAGGELETTATIVTGRNVVLNALGVINVEESSSLTLNGTISGTGGLALGSGTLILTGTNTYQGVTTIADGTLSLTGTGSIAASAGVVANGTLDISGTTSGASITSLSGTGSVVMGAQALTLTNASGAFSGTIGGTGGLTLAAGTQALSGVNGFTGATSILGGTLALTGAGSLAASSGLLVSGTFDISGVSGGGTSIRTLSGTGAVVLGANVLTLTNPSGTFQGAISGLGGLTISSGTLTLTGNNTYTGGTVISGGTLQVGDGGTTGAIVGDVTNNGTLVFNRSGTLSLAGAISGTGNVVQAGPGTLILTGAGSYSGGTAVLAGGLVLGSSTAAGTGVITLSDGTSLGLTDGVSVANALALSGAVTFDIASGTATASGALSGSGSLAFTGGGRITLTADNSAFSGGTTVDGTLSVNGVLGGTVSVLAGGTLKGNGTVGSTSVAAGGTVAPGNSIGTLTVDGTLTFASGATYAVEIDTTGASDLILVTGTATLGGATVDVTKAAGSYLPGTHYTILTAQGGLDGTFGTLTQDMPFIDLLLSYDTQNAYLDVARNATPFPSVAVTANQRATAGAVEALGQGNAVYNAVVSQTSVAGAQQAFNTLDGEIYPSALSVLQQESLILRRAVLDRARVPASTGTAAPLAYAAGSAAGADVVGMAGSPNAFWAQAFGAWSRIDGNGNAATISGDTAGVIVGYDRTFAGNGADWRLGFAAGYSSSGYQVDDRSSSFSSDNAHVALYGGTSMGALGIRAGAAYSWADISASRTVAFPGFLNALDADTSARTGQVFGEVGYGLSFAKVQVEPFAGLAYVNVDMNGFTELGGPSALTASGTSAGVTYSTLGARLSIPFSLGALPAAFNGTLAWQHAFGDTSPDMLFAFGPGALPFSISGVPIASDAALVEAGLDLTVAPNAALSVFYAGQLSQSDTSNMVKGSFTLKF